MSSVSFANQFYTGLKGAQAAGEHLTAMVARLENLVQDNLNAAKRLEEIAPEIEVKEREARVELGLRVKENETKVLNELIQRHKLSGITQEEERSLRNLLAEADNRTSAAVQAVEAKAKAQTAQAIKDVQTAESQAKILLESQVRELTAKIKMLEFALDDARNEVSETRKTALDMVRASNPATVVKQ